MSEPRVDIYPVGWLAAIKHRRLRSEWRYVLRQASDSNWRAVRNTFNGYLAEPTPLPIGLRRCGSGWTKRRALRSLQRHMPETKPPPHPVTERGQNQ